MMIVALRVRQRLLQTSFVTKWAFNKPKAILSMTLLWTLTAFSGALIYGSAVPFDAVTICTHGEPIVGFYIGQSCDRIYLGEKTDTPPRRILSLGLDEIDGVFVGEPAGSDLKIACSTPGIWPSPSPSSAQTP